MEIFNDDKNLIVFAILCIVMAIVFGPTLNPLTADLIKVFGGGLLGMARGQSK